MASLKRDHPDVVRILRLVKYELEGQASHLLGKLSPARRRRVAELKRQTGLKLHIASGRSRLPGWVNIDVSDAADVKMDLRRPLPLASSSARMIFCEHFCDHISHPHGIRHFMSECYRLLEPGGVARFVLHDAGDLMKAYVAGDRSYFKTAEQDEEPIVAVNMLFRFNDFHQFLYDYPYFSKLLDEAGFKTVRRCAYQVSATEGLAMDFDHPSREVMSMYVEAEK